MISFMPFEGSPALIRHLERAFSLQERTAGYAQPDCGALRHALPASERPSPRRDPFGGLPMGCGSPAC
jgi:hypothetical protein